MTRLPQGWALAAVRDVVDDYDTVDPQRLPDQRFAYVDIGAIDNSVQRITEPKEFLGKDAPSRARRVIKTGDVLFSTVRTYLKNVAQVPPGLDGQLTSTGISVLRANSAADPAYLFRWACSDEFINEVSQAQDGTMYPAVRDEDVLAGPIPLPPLREQRRIVHKLDTLSTRSSTARTHLTAIEKLVERYKRGVLGQFFPEDLPKTPLGQSCTKIGSGATPRGGKNVYLNEGTPLIRSQNVRFEGFDWDGLAFISDEHADELRNVTVQTGDVLLNITGASIGRVCLAPEEMEGARVNQHVSIIRPRPQELDARFVQHFLSSPMIQNWIWNENYGVTRQALTKGMIEEIGVPDVVIEEQREIVRRIETAFAKIDRLKAEAAKALKLLGHLDGRILAKAFAGDLVPQDANDEPASVLLERIREARATAPKKQRQRRTKAHAMTEAPKDRLLADSATWPRNGLPFEDIATRVTMPHDELRDAIFQLLGGEKPLLEQVFDTAEERMRLKRVAQ